MTNYKKLRKKNQQLCPQGNFYNEMADNFCQHYSETFAEKFLTRRLLPTVLRKLSEFRCSTNVGPWFFPIDSPATGAGSMYGRNLWKSVQFEEQTVGRRKWPKNCFQKQCWSGFQHNSGGSLWNSLADHLHDPAIELSAFLFAQLITPTYLLVVFSVDWWHGLQSLTLNADIDIECYLVCLSWGWVYRYCKK